MALDWTNSRYPECCLAEVSFLRSLASIHTAGDGAVILNMLQTNKKGKNVAIGIVLVVHFDDHFPSVGLNSVYTLHL